ncbi:MAG: hypothetical protein HQ538_04060 [Parcubacteria group bacterium]|nr:hypothetical protein [Parcubacteria group bacterium]
MITEHQEVRKNREAELDIPDYIVDKLCTHIAVQNSFLVTIPEGRKEVFIETLKSWFRDRKDRLEELARLYSAEVPSSIIIIEPTQEAYEKRMEEFAVVRKERRRLFTDKSKYASEIHELNIWFNPDKINFEHDYDPQRRHLFSVMIRYAQNLYLFDHKISNEEMINLDKLLLSAIGGECTGHTIIKE